MELTWLDSIVSGWLRGVKQGRMPHAVLLLGASGTGKRATAVWMARQHLGLPEAGDRPGYPFEIPVHADLRWIAPPEDKQTIGVDQIRELTNELNLTGYEGGAKVAIIEFAHAMTPSAANSLLKTLEEPPGNALIVLIADRKGHLPATIFSRCQRIRFPRPASADCLSWLDRLQPGKAWAKALAAAGGAPLAAIEALERLPDTDALAAEFTNVGNGRAEPLAVAARWARLEPSFILDWLATEVQRCIVALAVGSDARPGGGVCESVPHRIDRRNLFCYLDTINRLRGQAAGSFNLHLTLESLLIDWSEGLSGLQGSGNMDTARMSFVHG